MQNVNNTNKLNMFTRILEFLFSDYQNKVSNLILSSMLVISSVFLWLQYGMKGYLSKDDALYAYMGQQLVKGVPPYVSAFDIKTPMTAFLSGLGAWLGGQLGLDDLATIRVLFLIIGCSVIVTIYYLSTYLYKSTIHGLLSASVLIAFFGFGSAAASGPNPKIPLVLFVVLSLYTVSRKSYFWSAFFASLAFLTWQPSGILLIISITMGYIQTSSNKARINNIWLNLLGGSIPIIIVSLYFFANNALEDFVFSVFTFHIKFSLSKNTASMFVRLWNPLFQAHKGITTMLYPFLITIFSFPVMIVRRRLKFNSYWEMLTMDKWVPFHLAFAFNIIWIYFDFQGVADLLILLPFIAIIFTPWLYIPIKHIAYSLTEGGKRHIVEYTLTIIIVFSLLVGAYASYKWQRLRTYGLEEQSSWARTIQNEFIKDQQFVVFGLPEILVLLDYTNPNKYIYWTIGEDEVREQQTGANLNDWLDNEIGLQKPIILLKSVNDPETKTEIKEWLEENGYGFKKIGDWFVYSVNK